MTNTNLIKEVKNGCCKLVSIIIPNYNKGKYIEDCLQSVLRQTYPSIEIIVVDDCSTDNSRKIIENYASRFKTIKPVFLNINRGVIKARNLGVKKSSGAFLTFLDSDDIYYDEKKIEREVGLILDWNDIAYSQWVPLDEDGKVISKKIEKRNIYTSYALPKILSTSMAPYQQLRGYLITKYLFESVGGYSFPVNYYEDLDFQCKIVLNGKLKYTRSYGEGYRNTPGGLSKQRILNANAIVHRIQVKYFKLMRIDQKLVFLYLMLYKKVKNGVRFVFNSFRRYVRALF